MNRLFKRSHALFQKTLLLTKSGFVLRTYNTEGLPVMTTIWTTYASSSQFFSVSGWTQIEKKQHKKQAQNT